MSAQLGGGNSVGGFFAQVDALVGRYKSDLERARREVRKLGGVRLKLWESGRWSCDYRHRSETGHVTVRAGTVDELLAELRQLVEAAQKRHEERKAQRKAQRDAERERKKLARKAAELR